MILDPPPTFNKRSWRYTPNIDPMSELHHPLNLFPLLIGSICCLWVLRRPCFVFFIRFLHAISRRHSHSRIDTRRGSREHRDLDLRTWETHRHHHSAELTRLSRPVLFGENLNSEFSFEMASPLATGSSSLATGVDITTTA